MKLRTYLAGVTALALAACGSETQSSILQDDEPVTGGARTIEQPNIIWIMAEDMGLDWGVYGEPESLTPNIDRIAEQGMLFTHAFMTTPVCSTSRSALFTGVYASSFGGHQHRTPNVTERPLPEGIRLITEILKDQGYTSGLITDFGTEDEPGLYIGEPKTDWNFAYTREEAFEMSNVTELKNNQPFFAHIQFDESHRGVYWDNAHKIAPNPADPNKVDLPPYYPDHPIAREDWAQYLNAVMAFDVKVGYVLDRLEQEGVLDNSIIFITADNGRAHVRAKQWLYDSGMAVPLAIYCPETVQCPEGYVPGSSNDQLISGLDITATTLLVAGIETPEYMRGAAFFGADPKEREYVFGARDRSGDAVDYIRSVRTDEYLYIRNFYPERPYTQLSRYKETQYPVMRLMRRLHAAGELDAVQSIFMAPTRPIEELYDVKNDPHQINNLAALPDYQSIKEELAAVLETWQIETNDQGRIPESEEDIRSGTQTSKNYFEADMLELYKEEGMTLDLLPEGFSEPPTEFPE